MQRIKSTINQVTNNPVTEFLRHNPQYATEQYHVEVSVTSTLRSDLRRMYVDSKLATHDTVVSGLKNTAQRPIYLHIFKQRD